MPVNAIDNANLTGLCAFQCNIAGFSPVVSYVFDPVAKTVVFTDVSVFPSGDSFKKIQVKVMDDFGGEVRGTISAAAGTATVSTATLNNSKYYSLRALVISTLGLKADGSAVNFVYTAGSLSHWDKQ